MVCCHLIITAYLLYLWSCHPRAELHVVSREKLNHTDSYNDQWCLTEGDVSNCVSCSLVANKSMPACPQNVKRQPPWGFDRQTRVRLFLKWLLQKVVVLTRMAAVHRLYHRLRDECGLHRRKLCWKVRYAPERAKGVCVWISMRFRAVRAGFILLYATLFRQHRQF